MNKLSLLFSEFQDSELNWKTLAGLTLIVAIAVFAAYGNTIRNGYSVDDNLIVDGNKQAESGFAALGEIFTTNYFIRGEKKGSYRAIPRASFALEIGLFGKNPALSHFVNVLLFLLTCLLILKFLISLFPRGHGVAIVLCVFFFALHPIHTEVVASLKSRDELMQLLFNLIACILLINYAKQGNVLNLVGASFMFLVALGSKESAVHFLAIFPIVFYYASPVNAKRAITASAFLITTAVGFGLFSVLVLNPEALVWMDAAKEEFPFIEHPLMHTSDLSVKLGTALYGLGYYLRLYIFPHPLGFFYGYNQMPLVPFYNVFAVLSGFTFLTLTFVGLKKISKRSFLGLGIMIMILCLAIFSNLVIQVSGIIAERFAYASSLGFCMVLGVFFQFLLTQLKPRLVFGTTLVLLLLFSTAGVATAERNTHWKSYLTLANKDASTFTESAIVHFYLAMYIEDNVLDTATVARKDWWRKSAYEYGQAARIHPQTTWSSLFSANIYKKELNDLDSGLIMYDMWFEHVKRINDPEPLRSYGSCLSYANRKHEALEIYLKTIDAFPLDEPAYKLAAEAFFNQQETDKLLALMKIMETNIPTSDLPSIYVANLALRDGNEVLAIQYFARALSLKPDNSDLRKHLIQLYEANGMMDEAADLKSMQGE